VRTTFEQIINSVEWFPLCSRFIVLFSVMASSTLVGQDLWQNTKYGMSTAEVAGVVATATPPNNPERLPNGAEESLRAERVELGKRMFSASFFFLDDKLDRVTLKLADKAASLSSVMGSFDSVVEGLRAAYGHETQRRAMEGEITEREALWVHNRTAIAAHAMKFKSADASLTITFRVAAETPEKKSEGFSLSLRPDDVRKRAHIGDKP
jgi:hypothetical protein